MEDIRKSKMVIKKIRSYQSQEISWLEDGRIALGKLTLIAGDPGLGKSFMTLELAARVSRGEIGRNKPSDPNDGTSLLSPRAVIMSAEDDAGDTIKPRLEAMAADLGYIHIIEGTDIQGMKQMAMPELDRDMDLLIKDINNLGNVALIVIDPISAYMGKADSNNNAEVRAVLAGLAILAQRTGAAVVCVTHLNKDSGNKRAVYRAMGSLAFTAAARMVHLVTKHPGKGELDGYKRVVSMVKNNIGMLKPARVFVIDQGILTWLDDEMEISADELHGNDLSGDGERRLLEEESGIDQAVAMLTDELSQGQRAASELIELGQRNGIGQNTVHRAKKQLCVISSKQGKAWYWSLPERPGEFEHHQGENPPERLFEEGYGHQGYL